MKRKLISILLVISIFAVSVPAAFASENGSIEKTDPLSVAVFGGGHIIPQFRFSKQWG